jgi:hypothetical protein
MARVYHVIVNLYRPDDEEKVERSTPGEDRIRHLIETHLEHSGLRVTQVSVYRGLESTPSSARNGL